MIDYSKVQQKIIAPLFYYSQIDSTNTEAHRCLTHQEAPFFVLAAQQTAGRGRLNRTFLSPPDTGFYLSYVFEQNLKQLNPGLLTTSAAVVTAQAIQTAFHVEPDIKWVNDLYLHQKKVCGILAETSPKSTEKVAIILGIGINLTTPFDLPKDLLEKVGGLDVPGNPTQLALELCLNLPKLVQTYTTGAYLPIYRQHAYLQNKTVLLKIGTTKISGKVVDITANGSLCLQTNQGLKNFSAGEVEKVFF